MKVSPNIAPLGMCLRFPVMSKMKNAWTFGRDPLNKNYLARIAHQQKIVWGFLYSPAEALRV